MYETLKRETRNAKFRERLKEELGTVCANCGTTENIEYHHVVPLKLNGTNRISNIVPLCYACHKAAHHGRKVSEYKVGSKGGRKTKADDATAYKAFEKFVNGEIGNRKCKEILGYKVSSTVKGTRQYREFLKAKGIEAVRNNIDIIGTINPGRLVHGAIVGKITYLDGREQQMYFNDTGLNDVEYTLRQQG